MLPPHHAKSTVANVNGTSLAYDCTGAGSPMVLLHGFSLDRRMWDDQVQVFATTHTVLRYDLRGFGASAVPALDVPFSHADDLAALMDELGLGPAIVVGHSFGGWMAVEFALAHAHRLRALVLVDAVAPGIELSAEWDALADEIYEAARRESLDTAKHRWLEHPMFARSQALPTVATRLRTMVGDWSGWQFLNDAPMIVADPSAETRLHEIAVPTLVVVGEHDIPDFQLLARVYAENIPDTQLHELAGAGHMANMDNPHEFNRVLGAFIADLAA